MFRLAEFSLYASMGVYVASFVGAATRVTFGTPTARTLGNLANVGCDLAIGGGLLALGNWYSTQASPHKHEELIKQTIVMAGLHGIMMLGCGISRLFD